jgi:transcription antitermination factor NusG
MLKEADNPPMLPPWATSIDELTGQWRVAHTRARCEKVFAWELMSHGIGYFLPLIDRVTLTGGKKRRVHLPLFPSYIFFCGSADDRYTAMTTNRLCQTIEVADQGGLVRELSSIQKALMGRAELNPYPQMVAGQRCRIIAGVFKGLEGTVLERGEMAKILLKVSILGQAAMMEIEADLLEPIE